MRFSHSLKDSARFRKLYRSGDSAVTGCLVIYRKPNRTDENRIGITVGKKLGHAVVRNRARRRIREIYRLHEEEFLSGNDLVIVVRTAAVYAGYGEIEACFLKAARKLGLLREETEA